MKNRFFLPLIFVILAIISFSCEEEKSEVNEAQQLVEFLESSDSPLQKDYVSTDLPSIIAATDVQTLNLTNKVYIIDIRSEADYANGHIKNAVNIPVGNIITHVESTDLSVYEKIAVVCYTGQTAAFATSLLRLLGHDNVFSMKFGMAAWNDACAAKWSSKIGNTYALQFTSDPTPKGPAGALPKISTGESSDLGILTSRVNTVLTEGFSAATINSADVFANLENYYIVNYWKQEHYDNPGHIPGAMQYTPKESMKLAADLKTLPTDKTVVIYCYTGQTSAFLTAYLRVLGYDAKSLLFGTNGMIYDLMTTAGTGSQYSESAVIDGEVVQ